MGRNKGETYRKWKLKEIKRRRVPCWTVNEETLDKIDLLSKEINVCQSRIVEAALKMMVIHKRYEKSEFSKIFTKS
jgi:hypothetical protein